MKYLCKTDDTPEIKAACEAIEKFKKTTEEREQFIRKQVDAIHEERRTVWNRLWEALKVAEKIKPDMVRDDHSLSFDNDCEQIFVQPVANQNPFAEFFRL